MESAHHLHPLSERTWCSAVESVPADSPLLLAPSRSARAAGGRLAQAHTFPRVTYIQGSVRKGYKDPAISARLRTSCSQSSSLSWVRPCRTRVTVYLPHPAVYFAPSRFPLHHTQHLCLLQENPTCCSAAGAPRHGEGGARRLEKMFREGLSEKEAFEPRPGGEAASYAKIWRGTVLRAVGTASTKVAGKECTWHI